MRKYLHQLVMILATAILVSYATYFLINKQQENRQKNAMNEAKVRNIVADYLSANPEAVFAATAKGVALNKKKQLAAKQALVKQKRAELENDPDSPILGNTKGKVSLVMFADYNCGYCKHVIPEIEQLLSSEKDMRLVVKDYPILGATSRIAAITALSVHKIAPEKYKRFHIALFQAHDASPESLMNIAGEIGIDKAKLFAEMKKPEYQQLVRKNLELGESLGVNGTPAFVVNGELLIGALPLEKLREKIEQARNSKS